MQRKSDIYEQQYVENADSAPPLPIPAAPVLTATLSVRDQIMRCIKAAIEFDDHKELAELQGDDAQLAVDTTWEMLFIPPPARFASSEPSTPHRVKRARLRRLSLKLVLQYDKMPSALFLSGVQCHDREASVGGGFADVYCGTFGNMKVALKVLRAFKMSPDTAKIRLKRADEHVKAFYRESLLWQDLAHPHILPFLGVSEGVFKHSVCMVLPWMENDNVLNFMDKMKESGALSSQNHDAVINQWCYETALGLAYLHEEGIVHGDLRGANILVDENLSLRLTDFGMSVIAEGTGYNYGSDRGGAKRWLAPELISPEQFYLTSSRPSYASDVYSFALTTVELYTGKPPFGALKEHQIIHRVLQGQRPARPTITNTHIDSDGGGSGRLVHLALGSEDYTNVLKLPEEEAQIAVDLLQTSFYRESILWRNLHHRHVLPFFGITGDVFPHTLCMVLPWMEKGSIRHYINTLKNQGDLQDLKFVDSVNKWLYEIALGLSYLHDEEIMHGDLRGVNVLVDEKDHVRLADFGLAMITYRANTTQDQSMAHGGSIRWQAPELLDPERFGSHKQPTFASDIYAFGITCIELYTNQAPFSGFQDQQVYEYGFCEVA
ncbi:hypothetical protein EUX98_g8218 [Antrodiella citrinella]|uniref:Protein kinase domain-containing protein n=1 Tax=Antrodiella citrinella TaxID=2447956 RepID=A0A4S4MAM2_9APHY|nr:hypothetical protein EUX98_g8218 [Antrodiella citrinella]